MNSSEQASSKAQELRRSLPFVTRLLEEAAAKPGCALCWALRKYEERFLFSFLYEGMMTGPARQEFLDTGGFCGRHFRMAMRISRESHLGHFGLATLCLQSVPRAERELRKRSQTKSRLSLVRAAPSAPYAGEHCLFCKEARDRERDLVKVFEGLLPDSEFSAAVASKGLCLPHAHLAMSCWKPEARKWLAEALHRCASTLLADLREFQRKHEDRFRHEALGPEVDAVKRAMEFLAGLEDPPHPG